MRNPAGPSGQPWGSPGLFYRVARKAGAAGALLGLTLAFAAVGCRTESESQKQPTPKATSTQSASVAGARVAAQPAAPDDGQWLMPAKNYASTRFSELGEINAQTVKSLKVAWTFSTGNTRGEEAAPLVVGSTMYVVAPFPNFLYALDLANSGALKWVYKPPVDSSAQGVACCDQVNRGAAYDNGKIFYNTLDGQAVAVDAATGKEVWRTRLGDINKGESITMAPLVVKGKVLVGNSGGEFGVRGWLTALDAGTGKVA